MRLIAFALVALSCASAAAAQGGGPPAQGNPRTDSMRQAQRLDANFQHAEARAIYQSLIDTAPDAAAKAAAERRLAMSYGYDGNCAKVIELEERVIAHWVTRRAAEPQNAHYQEGEMANEAARVCIDHGFLDEAERIYRRGSELGNQEPAPRTHPQSLWDFRLAHALARLAARRGNAAEARRHVAEARRILDGDPAMAAAQEQVLSLSCRLRRASHRRPGHRRARVLADHRDHAERPVPGGAARDDVREDGQRRQGDGTLREGLRDEHRKQSAERLLAHVHPAEAREEVSKRGRRSPPPSGLHG